MTIAIYFGTVLINLIYYMNRRDKKDNKKLLLISLFVMGLVYAYGITTVDSVFYVPYYENVLSRTFKFTEIGFYYLVLLCRNLELGYVGMRAVIYIIGIGFLYWGLKRLCLNKHLFFVFYWLFLFFIDDIQLRNYISLCIMVLAFSFLINDKCKRPILYFVFFVAIATTFHTSSVFYLMFLMIKFPYRKLWLKLLVLSIFFVELIIVFNGRRVPMIGTLVSLFLNVDNQRVSQYFTSTTNGALPVVILIVINILLSYLVYMFTNRYENEGCRALSKNVYYISIIQLIWLPMLWLNVEFYRFPRNALALVYIALSNYITLTKGKLTKKKALILLCYAVNLGLWLWIAFSRISDWNSIFIPIFYENGLFN